MIDVPILVKESRSRTPEQTEVTRTWQASFLDELEGGCVAVNVQRDLMVAQTGRGMNWFLRSGRRWAAETRQASCACQSLLFVVLLNLLVVYLLHTAPSPWLHRHGGVLPRAGLRLAEWGFGEQPGASSWCQPRLRYLLPPSDQVTALASVPGSGNTWLRYLLQQSTGLFTGSEYHDYALQTAGFPGEGVTNGTVLVIKTHDGRPATLQRYRRAVLLLRHPRDVILAEFHRRHSGHLGHATREDFEQNWKTYVPEALDQWARFNTQWLRFPRPMHVVWYEDLQRNLTCTLSGLLLFLNTTVSETDLACAVQHPGTQFMRKKWSRRDNVADLYTEEVDKMVVESEVKVQLALEEFNRGEYTRGQRSTRSWR